MEIARPDAERIPEVFEDDETRVRTFKTYTLETIALKAIEHLIASARDDL